MYMYMVKAGLYSRKPVKPGHYNHYVTSWLLDATAACMYCILKLMPVLHADWYRLYNIIRSTEDEHAMQCNH